MLYRTSPRPTELPRRWRLNGTEQQFYKHPKSQFTRKSTLNTHHNIIKSKFLAIKIKAVYTTTCVYLYHPATRMWLYTLPKIKLLHRPSHRQCKMNGVSTLQKLLFFTWFTLLPLVELQFACKIPCSEVHCDLRAAKVMKFWEGSVLYLYLSGTASKLRKRDILLQARLWLVE